MLNQTRSDKVVIEDYHQMTTMDENVNWMDLTHVLSTYFSKPLGPLLYCTSTFPSTFLIASLMYTLKKKKKNPLPYVY